MSGQHFVKCSNRDRDLQRYEWQPCFAGCRFRIDLRAWRYQLGLSDSIFTWQILRPGFWSQSGRDRFRGVRLAGGGFLTEDRSDLGFTALGLSFKPMEKGHMFRSWGEILARGPTGN